MTANPLSHFDPTSIRFGHRVPLERPAELAVEGRAPIPGILRNASISGAFLETTIEVPLHAHVVITVPIAGPQGTAVRSLNACVVRLDASGVGVEWRDMATIDIVQILRMDAAA
jgi:hypothetical protein